jgi:redox-sensing transcriptional repressor
MLKKFTITLKKISTNTIDRLILYRKILKNLINEGVTSIFSYRLAHLADNTPAQVRRDLMVIGYYGSPAHGYNTGVLEESIAHFLDKPDGQHVAIIGLGKLGRALLDYCSQRNPKINIVASFDIDPQKVNRVINGCHCYHIDELENIVRQEKIEIGIITIPSADDAQGFADKMAANGVKSFLNYTPGQLKLKSNIYLENRDMMMALEKAAFFAKNNDEN